MKIAGEPYEADRRAGGGIAFLGAGAGARRPTSRCSRSRARSPTRCSRTGRRRSSASAATGCRVEGELRSLRLGAELARGARPVDRAARARGARTGYDADALDGRGRRDAARVLAAGESTALDIYVESIAFSNENLRRMGELAAGTGLPCARTSSSSTTTAQCRSRSSAGARSVDHLACLSADDVARLAEAEMRRGAAARRGVPRRRARRARSRARRRRRDLRARHRPQPRHVAGRTRSAGDRAGRARGTAGRCARRSLASTLNAAWVLRLASRPARSRSASAPTSLVLDGPIERIAVPVRPQPGRARVRRRRARPRAARLRVEGVG